MTTGVGRVLPAGTSLALLGRGAVRPTRRAATVDMAATVGMAATAGMEERKIRETRTTRCRMTSRDADRSELLLADLEPGREAELRGFLVERLERRCRDLGLERGVKLRCRSRDEGELELVLPDGETLRVGQPVASQIRVALPDPGRDLGAGRSSDEPVPFLEELFQGGTQYF